MYLVLIQTSGNQSYIFGTNKLRENVGASQLTYEAGTKYVLQAIDRIASTGRTLWDEDDEARWKGLLGQETHSRIESGVSYEVVHATSGNALVLARDRLLARTLVEGVTRAAAVEAPGMDVLGCIRQLEWPNADAGLEIRGVYQEFEALRGWRSGPRRRAQTLPVASKCVRSGLPASGVSDYEDRSEDLSFESLVKSDASRRWTKRQRRLFPEFAFPDDVNELERELTREGRWVAVAHGDGNGLGKVLQEFAHCLPNRPAGVESSRHYINCLRCFSIALERQARAAFSEAAASVSRSAASSMTPVIPLVLGGDDLTVLCAGSEALGFAQRYLAAFERLTRHLDGVNADRVPFLTGCVGVALVKPHFPFHSAYDLAEELLRSAKIVKKHSNGGNHSAIDFHVLYDSSFVSLRSIRQKLVTGDVDAASLTAKPYVTSEVGDDSDAWLRAHHVDGLSGRVAALRLANDEREPRLSRAQLHELRAALFEGDALARRQLRIGGHRYDADVIRRLLEPDGGFFRDPAEDGKKRECRLLDAIEVVDDFWPAV